MRADLIHGPVKFGSDWIPTPSVPVRFQVIVVENDLRTFTQYLDTLYQAFPTIFSLDVDIERGASPQNYDICLPF